MLPSSRSLSYETLGSGADEVLVMAHPKYDEVPCVTKNGHTAWPEAEAYKRKLERIEEHEAHMRDWCEGSPEQIEAWKFRWSDFCFWR